MLQQYNSICTSHTKINSADGVKHATCIFQRCRVLRSSLSRISMLSKYDDNFALFQNFKGINAHRCSVHVFRLSKGFLLYRQNGLNI